MLNKKGTTLVEVIVAVSILAVLSIGIYGAFNLFFQVLSQKKNRVAALAIANEKMEIIRNMAYNDIGTVGGIPTGIIDQTEIIARNNANFTIQTQVAYIDDPFDGTLGGMPDDLLNTDYNRILIAVSWASRFNPPPIKLISDIAPRGMETTVSGGTLMITVFDANGRAVEQADIHIVNNSTDPVIDITTQSNTNGKAIFPGAPETEETYEITVTKTGYSTDQTYARTQQMPEPLKPHASISEYQITNISFSIDQLSSLDIYTYNHTFVTNWQINTGTGDADQYYPSITTDANSNLYFAWQDDSQANNPRIYAQKYNSLLVQQWSDDERISNANNQSHASMVGDDDGNTYIAWQDDSNGNQDVYILKIDPFGNNAWTGSKKLNTDTTSTDQTLPHIVLNENSLYISWTDYRDGNADIYLHKIDTDKNYLWPAEKKVNSDSTDNDQLASRATIINREVVISEDPPETEMVEEIYLVWTDYRDGNADIYLQKIDSAGNKLWTDLKINSDATSTDQLSPAITNDGDYIYIAWSDGRSGDADIYLQKIDKNGNKQWANDLLVSDDIISIDAVTPAIIVSDPNIYLAWIDNRNGDVDNPNNDLYSQAFDFAGNKIWDNDIKINDDLNNADQTQPQIIIDPTGRIIYVWVDDRTDDYNVYASGADGAIPTLIGNVPLTLTGSKLISEVPEIYKYSESLATNGQGALNLTNMEWDTYNLTIDNWLDIANADPGLPFNLNPNVNQILRLYLE